MSTEEEKNSSIIQLKSNALTKVESSLRVTNKILEENDQRLVKKEYKSVKIGDQIWMAENLNVDRFRNGDPIPHAVTNEEWKKAGEEGKPAWCCYENDPANGDRYGKLYNWYAVMDTRGLAPQGWKIPTDDDWTALTDCLGGVEVAGSKMKSTGTEYWINPNTDATNESGFSGLPGGHRGSQGSFENIGRVGGGWSATQDTYSNYAWICYLGYDDGGAWRYTHISNEGGFSVRCLRD